MMKKITVMSLGILALSACSKQDQTKVEASTIQVPADVKKAAGVLTQAEASGEVAIKGNPQGEIDPDSVPGGQFGAANSPSSAPLAKVPAGVQRAPSGLSWKVLKMGPGPKPKCGQEVSVHYTGRLQDGTVFDSSKMNGRPPLTFNVGTGRVIKGWDQALSDMLLGERREVTIPPHLAYGDRAMGPIPANATLVFEMELIGLLREASTPCDWAKWPAAK